jgi:hypothetical protein
VERFVARACVGLVFAAGSAYMSATPSGGQQLDLRVLQGYDSNVYQIASSQDSVRLGTYYLGVGAAFEHRSERGPFELRILPAGAVRIHPASSGANQYGASLRLRGEHGWRNPDRSAAWLPRVDTRATADVAYDRALFIRRQTREELEAGDEIERALRAAELPSRAALGGEIRVRARMTPALALLIGALADAVDYRDADGGSIRTFDRLDARTAGFFLEAVANPAEGVSLGGRARWRERSHPRRKAKTAEGESVDDTTRRYAMRDLRLSLAVERGELIHALTGQRTRREDLFEGYHSYDGWEVAYRLTWSPVGAVRTEAEYAYAQRAYDLYAPAGSPTRNRYHDARGEVALALAPGVAIAIGGTLERTHSNDPLYDFQRGLVFTELRVVR